MADQAAVETRRAPETHALLLNGGGNAALNYRSHLTQLSALYEVLLRAGLPAERIVVLASDGGDPTPDLTTVEQSEPAEFFRLSGTPVEPALAPQAEVIDSVLPGVTLRPATRAGVAQTLDALAQTLQAGDTLLLYVTDHGLRVNADALDNQITLWGEREAISVRELDTLLARFAPGVRVVTLMSQCFSGAFSMLGANDVIEGEPRGNVCGYFSSTADRPAYGCFPENRGRDGVGHSFEIVRELSRTGSLRGAHEFALVNDTTPDVPLRTSDVYLTSVLSRAASARGEPLAQFADSVLREAFLDPARWEPELRLLERMARAGGLFSPRSIAELTELAERLPENDKHLSAVSRAWRETQRDTNRSNLDAFVAQRPEWGAKLAPPALVPLTPVERSQLAADLLAELARFGAEAPQVEARVQALEQRRSAAEAARYRIEVRYALVLRLRLVLLSIAGRAYLETSGTAAQRAALSALAACESFALAPPAPSQALEPAPAAPALPSFDEDVQAALAALPGWMGIAFKDPSAELRLKHKLPRGASMVSMVFPESPALAAGLDVGDIVLGPPGEPFTSQNQVRAWTMLSEVGKPGTLEVLRGTQRKKISITPKPYPIEWPTHPAPIKVEAKAPTLRLKPYRGALAPLLKKGKKHILFFWATWCGPCKAAVPELLAFEKESKIPVIAVTDESPAVLDAFFQKFQAPFPRVVAIDELRRTFLAYGVSGTPTFVLVDANGKVAGHQVGYDAKHRLDLPQRSAPARTP